MTRRSINPSTWHEYILFLSVSGGRSGGRCRWPVPVAGAGDRWPVTGGRWPVAGGRCRWPVASGPWPVAGPVAGGRWPVAGGRWPVAGGHRCPVWWPVAGPVAGARCGIAGAGVGGPFNPPSSVGPISMLGLRPPGISNLTEHQLQHSHIHLTPARLTRLLDAKISMSKHHETPCCCLALFFGLTQVHGWCSKPQLATAPH